MLGSELTRFKKNRKFLCWDTETENLNLFDAKPWQIAYGCFTLSGGMEWIKVRYIHFDDLNVSEGAAKVTNFDMRKYRSLAEPKEEVLEDFEKYLYHPEYYSIFHNGLNFDVYIHQVLRRHCGKIKPDYSYLQRCYDTSAILKGYKKQWKPDLQNFFRWQCQMNNHVEKGLKTNLTQMGKEFKIEHDYGSLHDAGSDIQLMGKVFEKAVYKYEF